MKYLLGATKNHEIVFAEFGVQICGDGRRFFSASFAIVSPLNGSKFDMKGFIADQFENMSAADKYDMCVNYDCAPSEVVSQWVNSCNNPRDVLDCSLYPERFCIDGEDWYFESGACGQCDPRQYGMERYINKKAFDDLMELWDQYYLREISDDGLMRMHNVSKALGSIDEKQWITNYIRSVRARSINGLVLDFAFSYGNK